MHPDRETELDALLDAYDARVTAERRQTADSLQRKQQQAEAFKDVRRRVIRPAMEAIGKKIKDRGHDYRISERDSSTGHQGEAEPASIEMCIYPAGINKEQFNDSDVTPAIAFSHLGTSTKVDVMTRTALPGRGGTSGPKGALEMDHVTPSVVQQNIMTILRAILSP